MKNNDVLPYKLMVIIALAQGFLLLYLHQSIKMSYWPNHDPQWLFSFYTVVLVLPVMLLLGITANNIATLLRYSVSFAFITGLLGYYLGSQVIPVESIRYGQLVFVYALTIGLATFKALMYTQQIAEDQPISYARFFLWSWRNFLTLLLSLIFTGCFCLILVLWAALFSVIEIDFFEDLFKQSWFYYPVISLICGLGIIIFRRLTHVIDVITRLQQALMKFLLILIVFISIIFIVALPFSGLAPLWKSGGSALILWMQALILFFTNAVYKDDPEHRPYSVWVHRFIYIGIALLPIYSLISFYGLSLRVEQYGWSLARCWAFLIWFLLALFSFGYWWGIVKKRDHWIQHLSRVNVVSGLIILLMMILINSPVLDFRKIVVNDQMKKLASHQIDLDDFDIKYFRHKLAGPGYDALQKIKGRYAETHPEIVVRISRLYGNQPGDKLAFTREEFVSAMTIFAEDVPPQLLDTLYKEEPESWHWRSAQKYYLQSVDLNEDLQADYLFVIQRRHDMYLRLYYLDNEEWHAADMHSAYVGDKALQASFLNALKLGDFKITRPEWGYIEIEGKKLRVRDNTR